MGLRAVSLTILVACSGGSSVNGGADGPTDGSAIDAPAGNPIAGIATVTLVPTPATATKFLEGPQWRQAEGDWLLSNIDGNVIYRYLPGGAVTPLLTPSGKSNGLAREVSGAILAAEHDGRRVSRITGTAVAAVAERFEGKRFHSPNDVIAAPDGTIYFTDPPYGLAGRPAELDFNGVFRVDAAGAVTAEYRGATAKRPNGIALAPDGKTLYVAFTDNGEVLGFPVGSGGALGAPARAALTTGGADGMAVDPSGNLFVAANAGIEVFRRDGTAWGVIPVPAKPTNCAFGGADHRTLLITTPKELYQVVLPYPGLPTR
jgi:gluconolactonase